MLKHDLFFLSSEDKIQDSIIEIKNKIEANHIFSVLRKKVGDSISISDGSNFYYDVIITSCEKKRIECQISETHKIPISTNEIRLYNSLLKGSNFDFQLEKSVEIGVNSFHPLITDHVIAKKSKLEKWNDGIRTALKQSKQAKLISINEPIKLMSLKRNENELWIVPEIGQETVSFSKLNIERKNLCLFIGPEGGFSKRELEHFSNQGATFHSLGENRLRAETATWLSLTLLKNLINTY